MSLLAPALILAQVLVAAPVYRSAIVIGVNQAFDRSTPTLRYADDDAARYYEMFQRRVDHVALLTILDAESQGLFAGAASDARVPSDAALTEALRSAATNAAKARTAGQRAELYFVYVGHGRVRGGEAEVKLHDGALSRTALATRVLESADHDRIHVIIDACNAYHMVNARGDDDDAVTTAYDADFDRFVAERSLSAAPTVGVVLATSGLGATHEWSRYQGGVFSHEIRSALTGAADADGDGRVDYTEVEAFVAAANAAVPQLKGRPNVFVRPPVIERSAPLIEVDDSLPQLELSEAFEGHFYLEDDRGIRYAELNKAQGHAVAMNLVPRKSYALHTGAGAPVARFDAPQGRIAVGWPVTIGLPPSTGRGDGVPPGAFAAAFGPSFVGGYRASVEASRALELSTPGPGPATSVLVPAVGYTLAIIGAAAGGLALWQSLEAKSSYDQYLATFDTVEEDRFAEDVRAAEGRALALGLTAGISAAASAGLLIWDSAR